MGGLALPYPTGLNQDKSAPPLSPPSAARSRAMARLPLLWVAMAVSTCAMPIDERRLLREEVRSLFTHSWDSYMAHGFPRDVLLPLSCKGANGWGNMTLTLLDTLDTLALMGNATAFETAVRWSIANISFDRDETVSLFETNIRALGGLLSAHLLAADSRLELISTPYDLLDGGLLHLAVDLADRLLPALDTDSGIPASLIPISPLCHIQVSPYITGFFFSISNSVRLRQPPARRRCGRVSCGVHCGGWDTPPRVRHALSPHT